MSKKRKIKKNPPLRVEERAMETIREIAGYRYEPGSSSPIGHHRHLWDLANERDTPIMRETNDQAYILFSPYDENPTWNGPFTCSCGQSRWLRDGRAVAVDAKPDLNDVNETLFRLEQIKAKLDAGGELTPEEEAYLKAFAEALAEAIAPFVKAFTEFAQTIIDRFGEFFASEEGKALIALAEAYANEKVTKSEISVESVKSGSLLGDVDYLTQPLIGSAVRIDQIDLGSIDTNGANRVADAILGGQRSGSILGDRYRQDGGF